MFRHLFRTSHRAAQSQLHRSFHPSIRSPPCASRANPIPHHTHHAHSYSNLHHRRSTPSSSALALTLTWHDRHDRHDRLFSRRNFSAATNSGSNSNSGVRTEGPATVPLAAVEVRADGSLLARYIQKADVAGFLGVPGRDLRLVDASFRSDGGAILPRETVLIVHLAHVRVLITPDSVLVFDPINPHVEKFIPALQSRLLSRTHPMPFEFRALEAVLVEVCMHLSKQLGRLVPAVDILLDKLSSTTNTTTTTSFNVGFESSLDALLPLQGALHDFADRVDATRQALLDVLASDEDLSLMYLTTYKETGHRRRVDQHDEVEMMLENYVKQVDSIRAEVRSTIRAIQATENITQIRLDAMRNRVLRLEVLLNLAAISVASGGLVAGAFGMNLVHGMEDHPFAFWIVSVAAVCSTFLVFRGGLAYLRFRRIFW